MPAACFANLKWNDDARFCPKSFRTDTLCFDFLCRFFDRANLVQSETYTEELPPLLSALSAVALVWLAWAFVSVRSKAKAEKFYREKMIQNESIHPVLHASLQHLEHKPQMLALLVKNHGKGMAEQVRFKAEVLPDDEDARTIAAELAKMDMFALGTDAVASGETYGRVFADIFELSAALEGRAFKGILKLTAEYKKHLRRCLPFGNGVGFGRAQSGVEGNLENAGKA